MSDHVCPVWIGYLLASPIRKLFHNPQRIVGPYVEKGMTVLDVGSAMGFFSIPTAKMVGDTGKVVCVDCQPKMFGTLLKRAKRAGVLSRVETRACSTTTLGVEDLQGTVDVALAIAMVHEAPDPEALLSQIFEALKPGGLLLVAEPKGHVSPKQVDEMLLYTNALGFKIIDQPIVKRTKSYVLKKVF